MGSEPTIDELVRLRRVRDLIDREFDRPLTMAELAATAYMSPGHFHRRYRQAFDETPYQRIMLRRVERAKRLFRESGLSVTEVCMAVGSTSLGSFSARFTEIVGMSPTAYRVLDHSALDPLPDCEIVRWTRPVRSRNPGLQSEPGMAFGQERRSGPGTSGLASSP